MHTPKSVWIVIDKYTFIIYHLSFIPHVCNWGPKIIMLNNNKTTTWCGSKGEVGDKVLH